MWIRRIFYLILLVSGWVFWLVYQKWLAWFLLLVLLSLPLFSLLLSLPAMLKLKAQLRCPGIARIGVPTRSSLRLDGGSLTPPVRCRIRLVNTLTGERYVGQAGELIPTEHCGKITVTPDDPRVYDYLGLFSRKLPLQESCAVLLLPKPVPGALPKYGREEATGFRPKRGGVAENYELRLFRPGDELRNIHWKLTAKTGKRIYREGLEPIRSGYVMTLSLFGSPQLLDRKLGQLLWSSRELLRQKQAHKVLCMTGKGVLTFSVTNENTLEQMLLTLVASPCADRDILPETRDAFWHHRIGGDGSEG